LLSDNFTIDRSLIIDLVNKSEGSYNLSSFSDKKESEVKRLKYQVDLFYKKEFDLYKEIGLKDGMNLIECGSGPGFHIGNIVRDLPHCKATALEIDPFLVEHLKKNSIVDGKKLYEVKHASIYSTGLPDNYFNFAIARLVMEHLSDPLKALVEVKRILKPEGKFVIVSNDFSHHLLTYPPIPELDQMYAAYINSRISEGGNPLIGRQLPVLIREAGFEDINIEIICVHSELTGDNPLLKSENVNISKSLVKEGFLKKETLESLTENWYKMLQDPQHAIYRQLFVISGTKGKPEAKSKVIEKHKKKTIKTEVPIPGINDLLRVSQVEQKAFLESYFLGKVESIIDRGHLRLVPETRLSDIDIDSISAAELSSIVRTDFNTVISIADILQKFSIHDIVDLVLSDLKDHSSSTEVIEKDSDNDSKWTEGEL
jgi:ubiquinone/menaquinone biosynthesis C-methylase UbiE/acyl carrier protein